MSIKTRIIIVLSALSFLVTSAFAEDDNQYAASPERVQIISIGGKSLSTHPSVINVLPGEQISFGADILQSGNACYNPDGCREGKAAEEFIWTADNREDNECAARHPNSCGRSNFQTDGNEIVFHIPASMGREITIKVTHETLSLQDTIVLHNSNYPDVATDDVSPYVHYDTYDSHNFYTLAPTDIHEPYWYPYYPYDSWWGSGPYPYYPYAYWWGPYPYYRVGWWGWGGPGWSVGFAFYGGGWGWGWGRPYRGWTYAGSYHPGFYGYYRSSWSHPTVARYGAPVYRSMPARPMGYGYGGGYRSGGGYWGGRGGGRRWR